MGLFGKKKDAASLLAEGHALLRSGQAEKAAAKFKAVTDADPQHAEAWYCLGTIYGSAEQFEAAIDCYRKSAEHAPPQQKSLPLFNLGNALQSLGKLDEALEVFTFATDVDPEMADAWINRGRLLDDAGFHTEAIDSYDKALTLTPDDTTALANRGNSLRALNRFAEARSNYETTLTHDPHDLASLSGLGICLSQLGQPEQGLRLMDKALELVRFPPLLVERATILSQLNRHDEALSSIDEAIRLGVENVQVYNNQGEILAKLERVPDSIASFDKALKLDPHYAPALFGKARVLCNAGMFGPARETIDLYFQHSDGTDGLGEAAKAVIMLCDNAGVG